MAKLKDSQLEIREVKKKIQVVERNGNGGASYRVGTPKDSNCWACVKWSSKFGEADRWSDKVPVPPSYIYKTPVYNLDNVILEDSNIEFSA